MLRQGQEHRRPAPNPRSSPAPDPAGPADRRPRSRSCSGRVTATGKRWTSSLRGSSRPCDAGPTGGSGGARVTLGHGRSRPAGDGRRPAPPRPFRAAPARRAPGLPAPGDPQPRHRRAPAQPRRPPTFPSTTTTSRPGRRVAAQPAPERGAGASVPPSARAASAPRSRSSWSPGWSWATTTRRSRSPPVDRASTRRGWRFVVPCCAWPRRWALADRSDRVLTRIAGAVADGEAVDWDGAERVLPESRRGIARALRTIAESSGGSSRPGPGGRRPPAPAVWLWPILGLGAAHVALGLAGSILGPRHGRLRGRGDWPRWPCSGARRSGWPGPAPATPAPSGWPECS